MQCARCGSGMAASSQYCAVCGARSGEVGANGAAAWRGNTGEHTLFPPSQAPWGAVGVAPLPMRWFKFVIYFQLFAGAAMGILNAVLYLTGLLYGDMAQDIYAVFGMLHFLNVIMGIASIVVAVLYIVARQMLTKFKRSALVWLVVALASSAAINLLYVFAFMGITGASASDLMRDFAPGIVGPIGLIIGNVLYFKKRKSMFIN